MEKEVLQAIQQQSRQDFLSFCVYNDKFYELASHHEIIADALNKILKWEIQNLMICMPPRAWKSRIMQESTFFIKRNLYLVEVSYNFSMEINSLSL